MHVDPLAPLIADGLVDEVVARLKSGKEADLWLVRHAGEVVAAKVYKARETRSFKNDAGYREGRKVRDTRTQRAMDRGSRFGRRAAEEAWKAKESDALHALHHAGVAVPRPILFYEGVLLMELVLDDHGRPAPRLVDAHVPRERAAALYADLRAQVVRMLCADLIHGDLSPYNVLLGARGPVIIDFPQVVGAAHNSRAEGFLHRDVENLRRFLAALDPALRAAAGDAAEIWRAYARRELGPDFVPSGRAPEAHRTPQHPHARSERTRQPHGQRREAHPQVGAPPRREGPRPGTPAAAPRGGGADRRRGAPAPDVVRIVRPVQRPGPASGAAPARPPAAHPRHPQAVEGATRPAAPQHPRGAGEQPGRRRRSRRRGGGGGGGGGGGPPGNPHGGSAPR